jgi:hypothetical protein
MHPRQRPRHAHAHAHAARTNFFRILIIFPGLFLSLFDHETSGGGPFDNLNLNSTPVPKVVFRKIPKSNMLPNVTFFIVFLALCHPLAHGCNIFIYTDIWQ